MVQFCASSLVRPHPFPFFFFQSNYVSKCMLVIFPAALCLCLYLLIASIGNGLQLIKGRDWYPSVDQFLLLLSLALYYPIVKQESNIRAF